MKKKTDFTVLTKRPPINFWAWFWGIGTLLVVLFWMGESVWITKTWMRLYYYDQCGDHRAMHNILVGGSLNQGPCGG